MSKAANLTPEQIRSLVELLLSLPPRKPADTDREEVTA